MQTRVTKQGDSIGVFTLAGQRVELLRVGGRTYLKAPTGLLPGDTDAALALRNRWVASNASGALAPRDLRC